MSHHPYKDAHDLYWQAGWRGILPLPHKRKKTPPTGYTGATGTDPAYPDVHAWADDPTPHNICLRLPGNVIGIDVDAYGDKSGGRTLTETEAEWGLLPPTWRSTSRDDGTSGIRLYRIPEGLAWPNEVGAGIETVHRAHRYTVCWPSIHPDTDLPYRWITPDGLTAANTVPDPDQLPPLPDTWVQGLTGGEAAAHTPRDHKTHNEAVLWIAQLDHATDQPCRRIQKAADQAAADLQTHSAHDTCCAAAARILRLGHERHHGAVTALAQLRAAFTHEVTSPRRRILGKTSRTQIEADREWADILTSGVNLIAADPTPPSCDCYGQLTGLIATTPTTSTPIDPANTPDSPTAPTAPEGPEQLLDGATFVLDAPDRPPALWGWGDEVLWAEGESLMIVGPPGVGKTTLCGQLLRARLGCQHEFLGWGVTPTSSRVLYLAMDRPAQIARSLKRHFTETDRPLLAERLQVWQGPPPADIAKRPDTLTALAKLAAADTIIIDSVKDAAVGLVDDTVASAYNRARQQVLSDGIQLVELHHMTKRGPNGSKPKDLADVYGSAWITAGAGSVVLIWGQAGDPVVTLEHLKQPAADIGPLTLIHDHKQGTTHIDHETVDLQQVLRNHAASGGLHPRAAAVTLFATTGEPSRSDIEKARRRLDALVEQGTARVEKGHKGGYTKAHPNRYFPVENP